MMLQAVGGTLVITSAFLIGWRASEDLEKEYRQLGELQRIKQYAARGNPLCQSLSGRSLWQHCTDSTGAVQELDAGNASKDECKGKRKLCMYLGEDGQRMPGGSVH